MAQELRGACLLSLLPAQAISLLTPQVTKLSCFFTMKVARGQGLPRLHFYTWCLIYSSTLIRSNLYSGTTTTLQVCSFCP